RPRITRLLDGSDLLSSTNRAIPRAAAASARVCERIAGNPSLLAASNDIGARINRWIAEHGCFRGVHGAGKRLAQKYVDWGRGKTEGAGVAVCTGEYLLQLLL